MKSQLVTERLFWRIYHFGEVSLGWLGCSEVEQQVWLDLKSEKVTYYEKKNCFVSLSKKIDCALHKTWCRNGIKIVLPNCLPWFCLHIHKEPFLLCQRWPVELSKLFILCVLTWNYPENMTLHDTSNPEDTAVTC